MNCYDADHELIGYAAVGYSAVPMWSVDFGCRQWPLNDINTEYFDTWEHRRGVNYATISFFHPDGTMAWCKALMPGTFYGVAQTEDGGGIVAIGEATINRTNPDPNLSMPIYYNPMVNDPGANIAPLCEEDFGLKFCVAKYDIDGTAQWVKLYGPLGTMQEAWTSGSRGESIKPITYAGQPGLIAAGYGMAVPGDHGRSGMVLRMDLNGNLLEAPGLFNSTTAGLGSMNLETEVVLWMQSIDVAKDQSGTQHAVITGAHLYHYDPGESYLIYLTPDDSEPYGVDHMVNTRSGAYLLAHHDPTLRQFSTSAKFVHEGSALNVLWPVLSDYDGPKTAGPKSATLVVHKMDITGGNVWAESADLHEVRAFDLQADVCPLSDGVNFAVLSTRYVENADPNAMQIMEYDDLTQPQIDCLTNTFGYDTDPTGTYTPVDWPNANYYGYWNTDPFVTELTLADHTVLWQKQFDANEGEAPECYPGDLKKEECMYRITEAPDGGLVLSGNTSDNQDDNYLVKLAAPSCQSTQNYTAINALLDPNNEYHITTPTTWSSDMNVHGKVVVDPGATLTINNNAVIQFADSKQLDHPTELVVAKGGRLAVNGNARLTSITQCPASMWDGIRVMGDTHLSQDPVYATPQGMASLSGATIENARAALLTGDASFNDPTGTMHASTAGGYIRASYMTFKNNRYDVVMRRYENRGPNDFSHVQNNRSYFNRCAFAEDAILNDGQSPKDHVYLNGVRGINFTACTFAGVYQEDQVFHGLTQVGTGIRSINSSFSVSASCTTIQPYGVPCPEADVLHSTFDKLGQAVVATAFTPDKTFIIDGAVFTNCPRAIRAEGVRNAGITRNTFNVVDFLNPYVVGTPYGTYLDQCTGYKIENNAFTSTGSAHKSRTGLVIKDSGPEYNTFYNNTFDNFSTMASVSSLIQGQNANANYQTGLEVKCNEYGQYGGDNRFDVALTGPIPTVQATQGTYQGPQVITAPAGNLFSLAGQAESDWDVSNASNYVTYYSHDHLQGSSSEPWIPVDFDYMALSVTNVQWPSQNRAAACPDNFDNDGRLEKMQKSATADADLTDSKDAYEATKDNGDTYSLESYVADLGHSSTQVRNALQSVAPKVSTDVWKTVFTREPDMDPWPLTQALVANSPLQPEVMKMAYESDLNDFYYNLVESAQSGDVNVLSQMESEMAKYAAEKGESLTDLGRMSWLDTTDVGAAMEYLKLWHDSLPADDGASVKAGYYAAKGDMPALYSMAEAEKLTSATPEVFEVLKRYADHELNAADDSLDAATVQWLTNLAADRWTIGSAQASAWLQEATGVDPLDEVIILPDETEQRSTSQRRVRSRTSQTPMLLQAYPNPSEGPVYVVCNVPEGVSLASLRISDLNGRLVKELVLDHGAGIAEIQPGFVSAGIYIAELRLDDIRAGQVKLALQ